MSEDRRESGEIWVNEFTEKSAQKFREKVLDVAMRGGEQMLIPIYIDSYGGYVDSLAKMIETMDSVPNRFVTVVSGKAMSCGAILLSHGDLRWCGPHSRVMIHNVHSGTWGDAYDKEQGAKETMRMQKHFLGLLAKNCGMTYQQLASKIKESISSKEIWLDAQEAFDFGVVDYVGLPQFTPIIQMAIDNAPAKKRLTDADKNVERKPSKTSKTTTTKRKTNGKSRKRK